MAMVALMISVAIYKGPGSFWEFRLFDLLFAARCLSLLRSIAAASGQTA